MPSSKPNLDKINEIPMKSSPFEKTLTPVTQPGTPGTPTPLMNTAASFKTTQPINMANGFKGLNYNYTGSLGVVKG